MSGFRIGQHDPVVVANATTLNEALNVFPSSAVKEHAPGKAPILTGIVLGALIGIMGYVASSELMTTLGTAFGVVMFITAIVVSAVNYSKGHSAAYLIAVGIVFLGGFIFGFNAQAATTFTILLLGAYLAAFLGDRRKKKWWPQLKQLEFSHQAAKANVTKLERRYSSGAWYGYQIEVESREVPGVVWIAEGTADKELLPQDNSPVVAWYDPNNPQAAVLCFGKDITSLQAMVNRGEVPFIDGRPLPNKKP